MNELIHIRNKIQTRIKSMDNDDVGNYAKKMMRRCIKDIDAVIDANRITNEVSTSTTERYQAEVLHIISDQTKPSILSKWLKNNFQKRIT